MTVEEPVLDHLTDLVLTHAISPVAHRELIALLRRASGGIGDTASIDMSSERYEHLGMLGTGAMGEVLKVLDPSMGRTVAMKVMLADKITPSRTSRFLSEARTLASLQHPGIVPIYELGRRADGRRYFTMPEIKGSTLAKRISTAWCASTLDAESLMGRSDNTLSATHSGDVRRRRLIDMLVQAADAVGFAHSRGIVHRDLKPHNIMVGHHGEVFVVDWGIAKMFASDEDTLPPDSALFDTEQIHHTAAGAIVGTPMYMAPEQILDGGRAVGPPTDVFALGAILLELLTGRRPRRASSSAGMLRMARRGAFDSTDGPEPIPRELAAVFERATAKLPSDRYANAAAFAVALRAWLDGETQREISLDAVHDADALLPGISRLRAKARGLRSQARQVLVNLPEFAPVQDKQPAWALEDDAADLEERARAWELEYTQALYDALSGDPDFELAHRRLADHFLAVHQAAERVADGVTAQHASVRLRAHHRGRFEDYLDGRAVVSVSCTATSATATVSRVVSQGRLLVCVDAVDLGPCPLVDVQLSNGRWLLTLRASGVRDVHVPIALARLQHWRGPGCDDDPSYVWMPNPGELGEDDVVVTSGWLDTGSDDRAIRRAAIGRVWVPTMVARRFAVTNREWITFIQGLVADGRADDARRFAPRAPSGSVYTWQPDLPVRWVSWRAATAFAAWQAARTGASWRLPSEQEWEHMAGSNDGRSFPWGDHLDPSWCQMRQTSRGEPHVVPVTSHPLDVSPYGVRGLGGNVRDWCSDGVGDSRVARGGCFDAHVDACRTGSRHVFAVDDVLEGVGLRLVRSVV